MKTASQFAEEISAIAADLSIVPGEPVAEEIADWRGPLQGIQVDLRRMIQQDIDKFMESAQKIVQRAEESGWSKLVIQNEVKRWSGDVNRVYAKFKNATQGFTDLVKMMGIPTRRHSTKGKAPGKGRGKMDWGSLSQPQLKKEVKDQLNRLSHGIHSLADDGAYMLHQIDRILKYKAPKDETIVEEIGALFQDFVDFRNAFGSKVWGPYKGLMGRLDSIKAPPLKAQGQEYRKTMRKRPMKTMPPTPQFPASMVASRLPVDCPELREAIARDEERARRAVMGITSDEGQGLVESIERELLGEADELEQASLFEKPMEEAEASKMKAKGYKFKILLKDKPPLYAKTEKGAKEVQADYPGSKVVANESGEIDDPELVESVEGVDLLESFEDFDSLLYGEGEDEECSFDGDLDEAGMGLAFGSEKPKEFVFSSKEVAGDFVKQVKGKARGKFSVKKTKGWATYSVVFKPVAFSDIVEISKHYKPEKPVYKQIMSDLNEGLEDDSSFDLDEAENLGVLVRKVNQAGGSDWVSFKEMSSVEPMLTGGDLKPLVSKGLLDKKGDKFKLTNKARPFLDEDLGGDDLGGDDLEEMSSIVKTIYQQFGGGRAMAMIGGTVYEVDSNTLGIKWPNKKRSKGNYVEIKYNAGKDLYDMEFFNVSVQAKKSVKKYKDVGWEQLADIFEKQTGWYVRM